MLQIISSAIVGVNAMPVSVETDISSGLKAFAIVGLPDASVRESRDRIRAAIKNTGFRFPRGRITVNLAPANLKKQGVLFDLPIAISLLVAKGEIDRSSIEDIVFVGELSLDGKLRPINGALTTALMCQREKKTTLILPNENTDETVVVKDLNVLGAESLLQVVEHLKGIALIKKAKQAKTTKTVNHTFDLMHVKGQSLAKRGLEIAASGAHNILLKGPPGTGKTLLAKSLPSILPPLNEQEAVEITSIASVAGELSANERLLKWPPFRAPHHSASAISLIGGGTIPKPGEISMAHRGILFLDELPEFSRHVLEHLRGPLEDGYVRISRAQASCLFPSRFLLIASMNPCPCGYLSDPKKHCPCTLHQIQKYQRRISGPLLDRFDLVIEVPNLSAEELMDTPLSESSEEVRKRVTAARKIQFKRFKKTKK